MTEIRYSIIRRFILSWEIEVSRPHQIPQKIKTTLLKFICLLPSGPSEYFQGRELQLRHHTYAYSIFSQNSWPQQLGERKRRQVILCPNLVVYNVVVWHDEAWYQPPQNLICENKQFKTLLSMRSWFNVFRFFFCCQNGSKGHDQCCAVVLVLSRRPYSTLRVRV